MRFRVKSKVFGKILWVLYKNKSHVALNFTLFFHLSSIWLYIWTVTVILSSYCGRGCVRSVQEAEQPQTTQSCHTMPNHLKTFPFLSKPIRSHVWPDRDLTTAGQILHGEKERWRKMRFNFHVVDNLVFNVAVYLEIQQFTKCISLNLLFI